MPQETRNYVAAITGTTVDDWAAAGKNGKMPDRAPHANCRELMALLKRAPNSFVTELEQHVKLAAAKLWGVQLAAGFDRNKALAMYARAMKRLSAVIGDQDPSLLSSVMRSAVRAPSTRCGSAPTRGRRRTISATASGARAALVSCCEISVSGADQGGVHRRGLTGAGAAMRMAALPAPRLTLAGFASVMRGTT